MFAIWSKRKYDKILLYDNGCRYHGPVACRTVLLKTFDMASGTINNNAEWQVVKLKIMMGMA